MLEERIEGVEPARHTRQHKILVILAWTLLSFLLVSLAFSPIFVLRDVQIEGNKFLTTKDICRIASIREGENLFSLKSDEIKTALLKDLRIEQVTIKKSFPSTLEIQIKERIPIGMVECDYGWLSISRDGTVIDAERNFRDNAVVPKITGYKVNGLFVGDRVSGSSLLAVLEYLDLVNDETLGKIKYIDISHENDIIGYVDNDVQIRIGEAANLEEKAEITDSFIKDKTLAYGIEYLDMRYSQPVIKFRDNS